MGDVKDSNLIITIYNQISDLLGACALCTHDLATYLKVLFL